MSFGRDESAEMVQLIARRVALRTSTWIADALRQAGPPLVTIPDFRSVSSGKKLEKTLELVGTVDAVQMPQHKKRKEAAICLTDDTQHQCCSQH